MGNKFAKFDSNLPSVNGKVFVITGTTSGTGFVAAQTAAKHGGEVLLLNRPSQRSVASLEKLKASVPDGKFVPIDCDLQDFSSVRSAVKKIKDKGYKSVFCLANNAGIMATPDRITKDGFDKQMQTNHLSHFLLTKELFPLILSASKKYGDARIVQHSSGARTATPNGMLEEKYLNKQEKDGMLGGDETSGMMTGPNWERYSQTKLANSVFNQCLHDKLTASSNPDCKNVLSLCAHPGGSRTNLADHLGTGANIISRTLFWTFMAVACQSSEDGAMGFIKGMMDSRANLRGGSLYGPKFLTGYPSPNPPKPYEVDPKAKQMLWSASEKATGVTFDI
jgi:NAD(P)-dependent dehydrogenase (short-subunit alcohol dehydrogenase family)